MATPQLPATAPNGPSVSRESVVPIQSSGLTRHVTAVDGAALPAWWGPLFSACQTSSIFLSPAWLQTWLEIYGNEFDKWWVHWDDEHAVVGGLLLLGRRVRVRSLPLYTLYVNASGEPKQSGPLSEFNDVLHHPDYKSVIASDLASLLNSMEWTRLALSGHEDGGLLSQVAPLVHRSEMDRISLPAPYIDLLADDVNSPLGEGTGRRAYQMRRNRRLFEARIGPISLTKATTKLEAHRFFDELVTLNRLRWSSKGAVTTLASEPVIRFHRTLIDRLWDFGQIDLLRVGSASHAVGFLYNFILDGKVSFFQSGLDYGFDSRLSPGLLTLASAIDGYRGAGHCEFDFLAGDGQYKRGFAKTHRTLHWTVIYRNRVWLSWLIHLRALKRLLLDRRELPRPG